MFREKTVNRITNILFSQGQKWSGISKNETVLFKGIAILLIVTHNFMHLIKEGVPGENEFTFHPERFRSFLTLIVQEYPDIVRIVLHYLGHYGVQVFIFLSAYGLTKKYLAEKIVYKEYLLDRFIKIYPAFILSILLFLAYGFLTDGPAGPLELLHAHWKAILFKLTLVSNFIPGMALKPVGPWWFLPFIFQFYLVFPIILVITRKYGACTLAVLSSTGILLSVISTYLGANVYYTIIGHMPELCLGVYLASKERLHIPYYATVAIILLFILGNLYLPFWFISHFCALILLLQIFGASKHALKGNTGTNKLLAFYGALSLHLFFVHGFLRWPLLAWARNFDNWAYSLLLCITFLAISTVASYFLYLVEQKIRHWYVSKPGAGR